MITFRVPGIPISQPRTKATRRGNHAGVYTPTKNASGRSNGIAEYKAMVKIVASQAHKASPLEGPLAVSVLFVFPRQKAKVWKSRPMPRYPHIVRPDVDNLFKSLADALKGIVWLDDTQVCRAVIEKQHAAGDEQPHCVVTIGVIPCD
jgi:Holliday junction resolvase RusA-like endonuclease